MNAYRERERTSTAPPSPKNTWLWLLFIAIGGILLYNQYKGVDFLVVDEEGNVQLSPEREEKMNKRIEELENAEQYVLIATASKYYPCYSCEYTDSIFLHKGEVWRYGVTTKTQEGRYAYSFFDSGQLKYVIQFEGTETACKQEEQRKIIKYGILPENLRRQTPLIRPPGNKRDD